MSAVTPPTDSPSLSELLADMPGGVPSGGDPPPASAAMYSSQAIAHTQPDPAARPDAAGTRLSPGAHAADAPDAGGIDSFQRVNGPAPANGPAAMANGQASGGDRPPPRFSARNRAASPPQETAIAAKTPQDPQAWLRDRFSVDRALSRGRFLLFLGGLVGTVIPVAQNEMIFRDQDPSSGLMNFLKFCNLLVSLIMLVLLFRHYMLLENFARIRMHLRALHPLDTNVSPLLPLSRFQFWLEILICVPCLPPFVTFEVIMFNWLNIVMYRAETLFCVYNSFRLYLCLPVVRDYELSLMPKRHTISAFTNTTMEGAFALKRILNGPGAMLVIGSFWGASFVITGYWFRAVEISGCNLKTYTRPECELRNAKFWKLESGAGNEFEKLSDLYLWNAFWGMFITATSVGYGDILATTHAGRAIAAIAAMAGLSFTAALTAALSIKLMWTEREQAAMLVVQREQARVKIRNFAVKLLQNWVRATSKNTSPEERARLLRANWQIKQDFTLTKVATKVDLADCLADSAKFDDIYQRTKFIFEAILDIEAKVRPPGVEALQPASSPTPGGGDLPKGPVHGHASLERQESFLVRRAKENVQKQAARKQASAKGAAVMLRGKLKPKKKNGNDDEKKLEAQLHKLKVQAHLRDLTKVAAKSAYWAKSASVQPVTTTIENTISTTDAPAPVVLQPDWRRSRVKVGDSITNSKIGLAFISILSSMIVMGQNEWVIRGNDPRASICELSKIACLCCSLGMFVLLYMEYWLQNIMRRLNLHLKRGHTFDPHIPISTVLASRSFWIEVFLCCIFLPPGVTGELSLQSLDNIVVYRWETILSSWTILSRLYLQWNLVCAWVLKDVPNRQNVAAFANIQFDSMFVMKRLVNSWSAAKNLAIAWLTCTLIFGYLLSLVSFCRILHFRSYLLLLVYRPLQVKRYLYRNAEISACLNSYTQQGPTYQHADCLRPEAQVWVVYNNKFQKTNDLFVWNAMWLAFVTMTTVGYGDSVPATHIGRFVCSCATISGILLASLITAAITNLLSFSQNEHAAISVVEREQARIRMKKTAVTILVLWWRRMKKIPLSRRLANMDKVFFFALCHLILCSREGLSANDLCFHCRPCAEHDDNNIIQHVLRREFLEHKLETMQEVEDLQGMTVKIHKVSSHMKEIERNLEQVAQHLWTSEEYSSMEQRWEAKATANDEADGDVLKMEALMECVQDEIEEI